MRQKTSFIRARNAVKRARCNRNWRNQSVFVYKLIQMKKTLVVRDRRRRFIQKSRGKNVFVLRTDRFRNDTFAKPSRTFGESFNYCPIPQEAGLEGSYWYRQ